MDVFLVIWDMLTVAHVEQQTGPMHKRLSSAESISFRVHAQGRTYKHRSPLRTIASISYAFATLVWRSGGTAEQNLQSCAKVWTALRHAVGSIPLRKDVIIGGDLNCPIQHVHPQIGTAYLPCSVDSQDQEELMSSILFGYIMVPNIE